MIESLMIDSIWEEVLPLACLGLQWLGPPFEQLIEGEQLGWHTVSNTTPVILHVWLRFFGGFISSYCTKQLKGSYFMIQSKWPRPIGDRCFMRFIFSPWSRYPLWKGHPTWQSACKSWTYALIRLYFWDFFPKLDYFESKTSKPPRLESMDETTKNKTSQVLGLIGDSRASTKSSFALHPLWYSCWKHRRKPLFPVVRNPLPLLEVRVGKC